MAASIVDARPDHASFIAWVVLTAFRSHRTRGLWDFLIDGNQAQRLRYLAQRAEHHQGRSNVTDPEKSPDRTLAGRCLCGAVRYAVADRFLYALNCHCSRCRRTTGAAFKPFAGIERSRFSIVKGQDDVLVLGQENAHDARCRACGSLLYSVVRDGRFVHVTLGTLVDDPTIRPTAHIFVGSKAPWFTITDGLPQHEELG